MRPQSDNDLKKIYLDIINGFSYCENSLYSFYIKHTDAYDETEYEDSYFQEFDKNVYKGILTKDQKREMGIKNGLWSQKKQSEYDSTLSGLKTLEDSVKKIFVKSQKAEIEKEIEIEKEKIEEMNKILDSFYYQSAEYFAEKKSNEYLIFRSLYTDRELKNRLFEDREIRELESEESSIYIGLYLVHINRITGDKIKKIAISNFFKENYYLADNLYNFLGKPIFNLTNYQSHLFSYAN
jgi:hypothetical protein